MANPNKKNHLSTILAIDTNTEVLVLAVGRIPAYGDSPSKIDEGLSPKVLGSYFVIIDRKHLEQIIPKIDQVLKSADVNLYNLGAIVVGLGPGSLIGSRVGLAVAKTMAQVLKIPLIGISTPEPLSPESLVKAGLQHFKKKQFSSIYELEPIYLRGPV